MLKRLLLAFILSIAVLYFISCGRNTANRYEPSEEIESDSTQVMEAVADVTPTKGNDVRGTVLFTKVEGGIKIVADLTGLTPGKHGFHVHEYGDCTAPDGSSAGGHFNPEGVKHGAPNDAVRHVGDMGNLDADNDGKAHFEWIDSLMSFQGTHNIIGRGVIIHAKADDFTSQPSGDAGARVACGIIEANR